MVTVIVRFGLRPGIEIQQALAEIGAMLPLYNSQSSLIHKQISLDRANGTGTSVYLWEDRAAAEKFFEMARPMLVKQTGAEPQIEILETQIFIDNRRGENRIDG